jgi:hypothetical protein
MSFNDEGWRQAAQEYRRDQEPAYAKHTDLTSDQKRVGRLARLTDAEYDRQREAAAEEMQIRVSTLGA